ncbi:MAG TPA: protein kinase [Candidatus Baltobacteraceae bacterium]|jgi:serine/threonine protein kinase/WD40 repeat protein|nr:protein kinase [Candidatus Baltobacteraceae bacterium]
MSRFQSDVPSPKNREEALFALALEKPAAKRSAFLDLMCEGDPGLRRRLDVLLAAHNNPEPAPVPAPEATIKLDMPEAEVEAVGKTIGRYKILEKVGEGGCGVVYVAEQTEPVRRRVALKIIKLGMDTRQVIARFEAERQALALMDHPNIAKVLDAGATDTGRPFFVMELVRGIRITEYCDQANLTTTERLDLFIKVCHAIQHAHQKGIIHRDIKPSNILVTMHDGIPVPKVIDFGIAKATVGQTLTDKTLYTQLQQFIGTPAYMSPEQAEMSGLDVDTRSDIYSLGVLLYELLAGSTPFDAKDLMSQGIDAMRKTIREKEPIRPSTRLATLTGEELTTTAKRRSAEAAKLLHQLKGDLDWIVMKCLEKDRTRRYETASGLAADLKRHLENEPVVARPPSATYRFQKAIRRNKLAYAAALAVAAALLVGTAVSVWQAKVALHALSETQKSRLAAQEERDKATSAQAEAESQHKAAEEARQLSQAQAYAADISLADAALKVGNLGRARQLLDQQRPVPGQPDLRNWEWRYLWQQCRSDASLKFLVQSNGFAKVEASGDGRWLAVAGWVDAGIYIFDISDLKAPKIAARLPQMPVCFQLACSPIEPVLAYEDSSGFSTTNSHEIHLWNFVTKMNVLTLRLTDLCAGLAFSSDGQSLVTLVEGSSANLTLWRCSDGARIASFPAFKSSHQIGANCLALSPDLGVAAYCASSNKLYVVDLASGTNRWTAKTRGTNSDFQTVAISPDGKLLVSGEGAGEPLMRFWDLNTGEELGAPIAAHEDWIGALRFLPDGRTLVSVGGDHTVRLWDVSEPRNVRAKGRPFLGQESGIESVAVLPDGKTLISGAYDGSVCVWDATGARPDDSHWQVVTPVRVRAWEFASDSQSILTLDVKGQVGQWHGPRFDTRTALFDVSRDGTLWGDFSKDARLFVNVATNGVVQVYDMEQRKLVRQFGSYPGIVTGFARPKKLLLYSPAGLDEWDLDTFQLLKSWKLPGSIYQSIVSDDGNRLLSSDYNGTVTLANLTTRQRTSRHLDINQVIGIRFSADGNRFAASSWLGYARIWDTQSFQLLASMGSRRMPIIVQGFFPDGSRLLTCDLGDTGSERLRLWDIKTQRELIVFPGSEHTMISPDGNLIVCSDDSSMEFYRAPTLAEIDAAEAVEK